MDEFRKNKIIEKLKDLSDEVEWQPTLSKKRLSYAVRLMNSLDKTAKYSTKGMTNSESRFYLSDCLEKSLNKLGYFYETHII